jgi:hypothetical protein
MFKKKYPSLSFAENFLGGYISIGRITIYGENAMHWGVNIKSKRYGYICFRLPFKCYGRWWPLYFYVSPNATPWAATFQIGDVAYYDRGKAALRRKKFGHNFSTDTHEEELQAINNA